jgi:pimeloyl-ACP methyl ester carboxylesterase
VGRGTYDAKTRGLIEPAVLSRLSAADKERRQFLLNALKTEPGGEERDKILAERGCIKDKASSYDASFDSDPAAQTLPVDAPGHLGTWAGVLWLQAEGIEPRNFASIRVPVFMVHGDTGTHPGAITAVPLKQHMPQLDYIEIAHCDHEPWRERHGRGPFFDILSRWIEEKANRQYP